MTEKQALRIAQRCILAKRPITAVARALFAQRIKGLEASIYWDAPALLDEIARLEAERKKLK